jgi:L-cysteine/cystine lyase
MDAAALRSAFPVLEQTAFLNAGSDGPLPQASVDAARASLDTALRSGRRVEHFHARAQARDELRTLYATVLGAREDDVAITTSTSEGLGKVIAGIDIGPGDEILTADAEHPGLLGPLMAARERGATLRSGPLATLADHVTDATTLIACSHVGWSTGELADPRLGATGVPLVLDGAQGVGAVPIDLEALGCAAYAGAGQKWLCGADGTGMLWLEPSFAGHVRATAPPYESFTDTALGLDSGLVADARRHGTPSIALELLTASVASTRLLESFGWDDVYERAASLAARLATDLAARGFDVAPRGNTTLVSWQDADPPATVERLAAAGVVARHLPGMTYVRASVGAWNDESDLDRLIEGLS